MIMNSDLEQEMEELADMPVIHKRMDSVEQKKKFDRWVNVIVVFFVGVIICLIAWAVGSKPQ